MPSLRPRELTPAPYAIHVESGENVGHDGAAKAAPAAAEVTSVVGGPNVSPALAGITARSPAV